MTVVLVIVLSLLAGLLASWAGAEGTSKNWRRWGIPLMFTCFGYFFIGYFSLLLMIMVFAYSVGYGIPSWDDEGSTIGAFWFKICNENHVATDICVRATVSTMKCLPCLVIPCINGNWTAYAIGSAFIVGMNVLFGGNSIIRNEGEFKLFGKDLLWEEFILGFSDAIAIMLMLIIGG